MMTIREALSHGRKRLKDADIASAALDSRLLLKAATGVGDTDLIAWGGATLPANGTAQFQHYLDRRICREPVAQIVGEKEFFGLTFTVTGDVLTPRPDSELLVETAIQFLEREKPDSSVCDLGTGSGALLVAILNAVAGARGTGVDISEAALLVAKSNAACVGVAGRARFVQADFGARELDGADIGGPFDVVVSNPPYICSGDLAGLEPEVARFEPRLALDGGVDGLLAYRRMIPQLGMLLKAGGLVILEIGIDQCDAVTGILADHSFGDVVVSRDLAGIERCISARLTIG